MTPEREELAAARGWMEQALALAALGEGTTSPNPRVGCVLVRDGARVGQGYHRAAGEAHAESIAIREAGDRARGATAYINLEPCDHEGRTPPCADLLVRSGVRRVVASITDPNPRVNGKGFARLREAGVEVETGLLATEARRLNAPFLFRHVAGRPMVTLKAAVSQDGQIAARSGSARWISGEASRRFAQRLRLRHDAVLVGANTVRRDDPELTIRLPGVRAERLRAILAPRLGIDPGARVFRPQGGDAPPVRIYVAEELPRSAGEPFRDRAVLVPVPVRDGRLDLAVVLEDLSGLGALSILVEGGASTFGGFLAAGLADRAALFRSPLLIGSVGATPLIDLEAPTTPEAGWRLEVEDRVGVGEDELTLGRIVPGAAADRAPR